MIECDMHTEYDDAMTPNEMHYKDVVRFLASRMMFQNNGRERGVVCCAPTGVAAILCGGQTLHSFVGCGVVNTVADFDRLWKPLNKTRWRAIKVEICCT